jgi:thiol-disulfide isomerase/thioredoxin
MRLKNASGHPLLMFVLCTSMTIISLPVMGSHYDNTNSTRSGVWVGQEFPDGPLVITDSTLGSALEKHSPLVLDCWEEGCRPCQLIDRKIDEIAADLKGQVIFGKLNINQNARTTKKYKIFN